ncbi:MAG: DUF6056 family protein [Treponema sp.]|nr:DUF6056 family protein [Treponema sp.]
MGKNNYYKLFIAFVVLLLLCSIPLFLPAVQKDILALGSYICHHDLRDPQKWICLMVQLGLFFAFTGITLGTIFLCPKEITALQRKIYYFLVVLICVSVLPILFGCFFSIPAADDFTCTLSYLGWSGNKIKYILSEVKRCYFNWQGTYFGYAISAVPVYYSFGLVLLRIVLIFTTLFFFSSLYFLIWTGVRMLGLQNKIIKFNMSLLLFFCMIFYVVNFMNISEIFFWYTGVGVYTIPLSFCFIAIAAFLLGKSTEKKVFIVLGILSAFVAAGGSLEISAFLCSVLLFFICYDFFVEKKLCPTVLIGLFAFLGALVNAIAPGNFVRHTFFDTKLNIFGSIVKSFDRINLSFFNDLQYGLIFAIFVIVFIVSYHLLKFSKILFKWPGLVTIFSYFCCVITVFPVVLGYNSNYLPGRCLFVERCAFCFFDILLAIYWGGWASKKEIKLFTKEFFIGVSLVCFIPVLLFFDNPVRSKLYSVKMLYHEFKGDFLREAWRQEGILRDIKLSNEDDVIVFVERPKKTHWSNLMLIGLSEDKKNWINVGLSEYYGKKSITVKYKD